MSKHPAVENLRANQRQLDADGIMVAVSWQAVVGTLAEVDCLRTELDVVKALHDVSLASCDVHIQTKAGSIPVAGRAIDSGSHVLVDQMPMAAARNAGRLGGGL